MQSTRERRSDWRLAAALVLLLCFLASMHTLGGFTTIILTGCIISPFVLPIWFVKRVVFPLTVGRRCPGCGGRPLRYVGCISFGCRFYDCPDCGLRCKRGDMFATWEDASGPEDDAVYIPKAKGGPSPCSGWLPDRRDVKKIVRAVGAFIAVFGWLLGCTALGLWINTAWGPTIGIGLGLGILSVVGREVGRSTARNREDLWDRDLDSERPC